MYSFEKRIYFLAMVILCCLCRTLCNATEIIDISHPDPNLFDRMMKDMRAEEQSREVIGYYSLGSESIEFRFIVEASDEMNLDVVQMVSPLGEKVLVSKNALVDSNDIYGMSLEKSTYSGSAQYLCRVDFMLESWEKIRASTSKYLKRRIGVVKNGKLYVVAKLIDPIINEAVISMSDLSAFELFKEGLILNEEKLDFRHKNFIGWLEVYVEKHPEDMLMNRKLMQKYYESKPRLCDKILTQFEKMNRPDYAEILYSQACYSNMNQYDRGLKKYTNLLTNDANREIGMELRNAMVEMYGRKGDMEQMIAEAEGILALMKDKPLPSFEALPEGPDKDRFLAEMQKRRDEVIRKYEENIDRMKASLKQNKE
jgi:hypothetical protein